MPSVHRTKREGALRGRKQRSPIWLFDSTGRGFARDCAALGQTLNAPVWRIAERKPSLFWASLPPFAARADGLAQLPIIDLALSGVIAIVGTVTVVGTLSAQSSRTAFAMSIACGPPVG